MNYLYSVLGSKNLDEFTMSPIRCKSFCDAQRTLRALAGAYAPVGENVWTDDECHFWIMETSHRTQHPSAGEWS